MRFSNDFEKASFIERCAFKNFVKLYPQFNNYQMLITDFDGKDLYDIMLYKINEKGLMSDRIFIEIKVRHTIFDTYFMETKKVNSIINFCKNELYLNDDEYKIWYMNFTPEGTFIWNVKKEMSKNKIIYKEMNKKTMESRSDKVNKSVYELDKASGKRFNYVWDENQLINYYNEYFNKKVEVKIKGNKGLEDILFS